MRTCPACEGTLTSSVEHEFRYTDAGLDNVVLEDIVVHRCARCGEWAASIPQIVELHRTLAWTIASVPRALTTKELAYLDAFVSGADLAGLHRVVLRVARGGTRARWFMPAHMRLTGELLIRAMAIYVAATGRRKDLEEATGQSLDLRTFKFANMTSSAQHARVPTTVRMRLSNGKRPPHWSTEVAGA